MKRTITIILLALLPLPLLAATTFTQKITGIEGDPLTNVEQHLSQIQKSIKKLTDDHVQQLHHEAPDAIKKALKPYGYFKANITSHLAKKNKQQWHATYHVKPGPVIKVNHVEIKLLGPGKYDPEFQKLVKNFPFAKNKPLNTQDYKDAKQALLDLAAARGYFDAKLTKSRVEVHLKPYYSKIFLHLDTGTRYHFGDVTFTRTEKSSRQLADSFLSRYIRFCCGDLYQNQKLLNLQNNLMSSRYFSEVTIYPHPEQAHNLHVPYTVELTPSNSKLYTFGGGFGTDTGIRGLARVDLRRLTSMGHYVSIAAKGASKGGDEMVGYVRGSYNIPGRNPITDLYKFSAEVLQEESEDIGIGRTAKLSTSYTTSVYGWQQTLALTLHLEQSDPTSELPFTSTLLIPSAQWMRVKSDEPLNANNGYRINLSMRGAYEEAFSKTSFFQTQLHAKWIKSLTKHARFIARGDLGYVAIKDIEDLPVTLRFAAGGTQSVRGYGYKSIGPGRTLSVASVELQHRLYDNFWLTGFFDAGQVSSSLFNGFNKSVGGGLVYRSPIGPIALTLARALDKSGMPLRLEFSMGPEL